VKSKYPRLLGEEQITQAAKENVLLQLEHLRGLSSVAVALKRGDVQLHGWVYLIESGEVLAYDSVSKQFSPLEAWLKERVQD
jgi:carbonic anhydrase